MKKTTVLLAALLLTLAGMTAVQAHAAATNKERQMIAKAGTHSSLDNALNPRQKSIVAISSFTAGGNLEKLKGALNEGLNAGLTVNEIKEVLVQLYAYAGFPRSLNAISTFMTVMDERKAKGIRDAEGREASPMPPDWNRDEYGARIRAKLSGLDAIPAPSGYQLFAPLIDTFLKEHLFADIFARDNLDHQSRELATVSTLASIPGLGGQLQFHMNAAMNTGLNEAQMKDFISVLAGCVGEGEAQTATTILSRVLSSRTK